MYYFRIARLFNEYKFVTEKPLQEVEQVKYFINGLLPILKLQLNNRYQNVDRSYLNISLKEVLERALVHSARSLQFCICVFSYQTSNLPLLFEFVISWSKLFETCRVATFQVSLSLIDEPECFVRVWLFVCCLRLEFSLLEL